MNDILKVAHLILRVIIEKWTTLIKSSIESLEKMVIFSPLPA